MLGETLNFAAFTRRAAHALGSNHCLIALQTRLYRLVVGQSSKITESRTAFTMAT